MTARERERGTRKLITRATRVHKNPEEQTGIGDRRKTKQIPEDRPFQDALLIQSRSRRLNFSQLRIVKIGRER